MQKADYLHVGSSADVANRKNRIIYRLLEMLPAVLAWGFLGGLVLFSFVLPIWVAVFIIAFDLYWLIKIVYLSLHQRSSYQKMRQHMQIDWWEKLKKEQAGEWERFEHLVILPMYNEPLEVVKSTFEALARANYDNEKMTVVLATEERAGEEAQKVASAIESRYGDSFGAFYITVHPGGLAGETPGKGSNEAWAARWVRKHHLDTHNIDYNNVILSVFDVDTNVFPDYFAVLTQKYLQHPNPRRASFQPVPLYTNNIWEAPALARVLSFSSSFWHMMQQERPERQATFSSHSMSFATLDEIGYWQTNIVSEDSRIFWQCYLYFDGEYETVSLYYPVSMDANVAPSFWRTMINQYKQQRRWGWGVENAAYVLFGFLKNKQISFSTRIRRMFEVLEGYWSWATNSIVIFLMGWLPVIVGGTAFNVTLLSYNLPRVTRILMTLALIGLVSSMVLSINLLPPRPPRYGKHKYIIMILQWIFLPFLLIFFGSVPALEAQTRLALGGKARLGFWVTPKSRIKNQEA